ncbi:MAG: hypothetical protein ABIV26_07135 [Candidatus Limnocylindrales bacterium]
MARLPTPGRGWIPRMVLGAGLALVLAGCGMTGGGTATGSSTASPASPAPSGACTSAPEPPSTLPGWSSAATEPTVFPVIVNSGGSLTCGTNRLLLTVLDAASKPVASPDRTVSLAIFDLARNPAIATQSTQATFVWGIEGTRGFYVANVTFPEAGVWGAELTTQLNDAAPETIRLTFDVSVSSPVVRVGELAPASDTPTSASVGGNLAKLSSDSHPDPAFYATSVKAALAAHEPFVLIFATPKFCVSAQCGPTLDRVKPLAADFPTVRFIHAEPYELKFKDGSLQPVLDLTVDPAALKPTQAVLDWGLLSEPWVFVVDATGIVRASFEGVVGTDELRTAIAAVK